MRTTQLGLAALTLLLFVSQATAGLNSPISFTQSGSLTLTLDYSAGGLDHLLEMSGTPGPVGTPLMALTDQIGGPASPDVLGFAPAALGDSVALGSYNAGDELIFRLTNVESIRLGTPGVIKDQTFTGTASGNNPNPGDFYTFVEVVNPSTIRVYWEDLFPISSDDPDPANALLNGGYDVAFTLTVPEPTSIVLGATALATAIGFALRHRRRV